MSTAHSYGGSGGGRDYSPGEWARMRRWGRACATRWTLFELTTMILGFMIFWPVGVAVFAYKMWQRRTGADDLQTFVTAKWNEARASWMRPGPGWASNAASASGNRAFDEWKAAELARLEAERRKLEDAAREFADFLDNIRHAKDREEFDRFMNDQRAKS